MEAVQAALDNLLSPVILFFVLGILAASLKSDLEIPPAIGKGLSLYLLAAIGFKGGTALSATGVTATIALVAVAAVALSLLIPFLSYGLLRAATNVGPIDAAAIAAHYGSVSVVTFVTATAFLDVRGIVFAGYLVAILALMETPAIVSGLLLSRRQAGAGATFSKGLKEALVSGSVVLLTGSLVIGWVTGSRGVEMLGSFLIDPFQGVLALFLLDMGLIVARRFRDFRIVGLPLIAFGLYMPLIGGGLGLALGILMGLPVGDVTLLAVLAASASYIAVPAAMRHALPQANPGIYVTLSLAVTFPFNVVIGIPLYHAIAKLFLGG